MLTEISILDAIDINKDIKNINNKNKNIDTDIDAYAEQEIKELENALNDEENISVTEDFDFDEFL